MRIIVWTTIACLWVMLQFAKIRLARVEWLRVVRGSSGLVHRSGELQATVVSLIVRIQREKRFMKRMDMRYAR